MAINARPKTIAQLSFVLSSSIFEYRNPLGVFVDPGTKTRRESCFARPEILSRKGCVMFVLGIHTWWSDWCYGVSHHGKITTILDQRFSFNEYAESSKRRRLCAIATSVNGGRKIGCCHSMFTVRNPLPPVENFSSALFARCGDDQ